MTTKLHDHLDLSDLQELERRERLKASGIKPLPKYGFWQRVKDFPWIALGLLCVIGMSLFGLWEHIERAEYQAESDFDCWQCGWPMLELPTEHGAPLLSCSNRKCPSHSAERRSGLWPN